MTSAEVVVLGAGPAGLMAAWRAARSGRSVVVVEAAPAVGGMAASGEVDGIRVDLGSHRLHPGIDDRILDALVGLLGADLQRRPRHGRLRLAGRWVRFPLVASDLVRAVPPRFALGAGVDALVGPLRRGIRSVRSGPSGSVDPRGSGTPGATFSQVVRSGLGPTVARGFYEPYVAKLWGVDPGELDAELARRRVAARSAGGVLAKLRAPAGGPGRVFYYPRRGFGQLSEVLAEAAVAAGVDLRLGSRVTSVAAPPAGPGGGRVVRVHVEADGVAGAAVEAPLVLSTLPLGVLAAMLTPSVDPEVRASAGRLVHRAMVLVYLTLAVPRFTPYDAHYLPDPDHGVTRLSEPRNYRDDPTEPDDRTVLCAEVPCWEGDERWSAGDDALGALVREALAHEGLETAEPVSVTVRRLPRVYPVYRTGFAADVARVEAAVADRPGLVTLGRQGLFVGDNTHHVLAMGWEAATGLGPGGAWDAARWADVRARFDAHVVED